MRAGDADVLGVDPALELVTPGLEVVDPRSHRVAVAAERAQREGAAPDVVAERRHLGLAEAVVALGAPAQHDADDIVPVGEAVGLDDHVVADDALGSEAAAVDRGPDRIDDGANAAVGPRAARHADSCRSTIVDKAGSVSESEFAAALRDDRRRLRHRRGFRRRCRAYTSASLLSSSRQRPACGTPTR